MANKSFDFIVNTGKPFEEDVETALEIINRSKSNLKHKYPELIRALNYLEPVQMKMEVMLSTDFENLYFDCDRVLSSERKVGTRDIEYGILHIAIHGLLGDMDYVYDPKEEYKVWLVFDQRVSVICSKLGVQNSHWVSSINHNLGQMKSCSPFKECFGNLVLTLNNRALKKRCKAGYKAIKCDDHQLWKHGKEGGNANNKGVENDQPNKGKGKSNNSSDKWKEIRESFYSEENSRLVETFCYENNKLFYGKGEGKGNNKSLVKEAEGKARSYIELFEETIRLIESEKEDVDGIDYMLYDYGLRLNEDIPLVEPSENKEEKTFNSIAIAIDTSGSCCGQTAEIFLRELKGIIRDLSQRVSDGKIIFIMCDDEIQKVEDYELREYCQKNSNGLELMGFGGTSFIPVFDYLNKLEEDNQEKIDMLIYLTDGMGDYPENPPDYPVIFVLEKRDLERLDGIPWWIKIGFI